MEMLRDKSLETGRSFISLAEDANITDQALLQYGETTDVANMNETDFITSVNQANESIGVMGVKSKVAAIKVGLLNTVINAGIGLLVGFTINSIVSSIDEVIHHEERLADAAQSAQQNIKNLKQELDNLESSTDNIKYRYAELAQDVDQFNGKNLRLSDDSYKEFLNLSNQLVELFPTLTKNYDENGNAILSLSGDVDTIVGSLNNLVEAERNVANQKMMENMPDIYNNVLNQVEKIQSINDSYQSELNTLTKGFAFEKYSSNPLVTAFDATKISLNIEDLDYRTRNNLKTELQKTLNDFEMDNIISIEQSPTSDALLQIFDVSEEDMSKLNDIIDIVYANVQKKIIDNTDKLESEMSGFKNYIYTWLSTDWAFIQIDDEGLKNAIQQILFQPEWLNQIPDSVDKNDWDKVAEWIQTNYLDTIKNIQDDEIKQSLSDLFTLDLTPEKKVELANKIQDYFDDNNIEVKLDFITDVDKQGSTANLLERVKNKNKELVGDLKQVKQAYTDAQSERDKFHQHSKYIGNVDIHNRPIIDNKDGTYATSLTSFQEKWIGDEDTGFYKIIHYTPILPDGTILDGDALNEYIDKILNTSDSLEADNPKNGGYGIVYKVDLEVNEEPITDENLPDAFKQAEAWDTNMHEIQSQFYDNEAHSLLEYNKIFEDTIKLEQFFKENSIDTENEYQEWLQVTEGIEDLDLAIQTFINHRKQAGQTGFLDNEEHSKAIDEYKSKISDLSGYLKTINEANELSASDMAELNEKYNIVSDSVGGYTAAIIKEMNELASGSEIIMALADAIERCDDEAEKTRLQSLYDNLQQINIEAQRNASSFNTMTTAISKLKNSAETIRNVKEAMDANGGKIDGSSLDSIISAFPKLTEKVAEFNAGLIDSSTLFNALTEAYKEDQKNYSIAVAEKLKYNEDFYDDFEESIPDWLRDLADSYGIDFKNYKSLAEAKIAVTQEMARRQAALIAAVDANDKLMEIATNSEPGTQLRDQGNSLNMYDEMLAAKKSVDDIQKIIDGMNTTIDITLNMDTSWESYGKTKDKNSGSDKSDDKTEIDWLEQSLKVLQNEVNKFQSQLDNTTTYKKQKKAIEGLGDALNGLSNGYKKAAKEYNTRYENTLKKIPNSKQIQTKIESGKAIDLTKYSQKDATNIQKAIDYYDKYKEAKQNILDIDLQIEENETRKYRNKQDTLENLISRRSNAKQDYQNKIDIKTAKRGYADEEDYLAVIEKNDLILGDKQEQLNNALERREEVIKKYGKSSLQYDEADSEVQELQNDIAQLTQEQVELNREVMKYPVHKLEEEKKKLEEQLKLIQKKKEKLTSAINAASNIVQKQIDQYNELKDATTKSYDAQIKSVQDKKDALQDENDALQHQLALEKAEYELEKARTQKTVKVFNGKEFVYESDQDAIKEAQKALDQELFNNEVFGLDEELKTLNKEKDEALKTIDMQIDSLEKYKKSIDDIFSSFEEMLGLQQLMSEFGEDVVQRLLNGDTSIVQEMLNKYTETTGEEYIVQEQIDTYQDSIDKANEMADTWKGAQTTIEKVKKKIQKVIADNDEEIKAIDERTESVIEMTKEWNEYETSVKEDLELVTDAHDLAKDEEYETLQKRIENLKNFSEQATNYLTIVQSALNGIKAAKSEAESITAQVKAQAEETTKKKKGEQKVETAGKSHSGMELGYIGENSAKSKDTFKYIALSALKPDEVPRLLLKNEAVLTEGQQAMILKNMQTSFSAGLQITPPIINTTMQKQPNSIVFNGDIVLQNVNNPNELASRIKAEFLTRLDQQLFK